jgi:putative transposase
MDKSGANKSGADKINLLLTLLCLLTGIFYHIIVRQIKYLNNIVEQDHRGIKKITKAMMGFKSFTCAEATIAGIELHRMLKKGQYKDAAYLFMNNIMYLQPSCAQGY